MRKTTSRAAIALLLASTAFSAMPALAQDAAASAEEEVDPNVIVVTAQKRSENLQNVPISIQALGTQKLDQLNIADFKGYAAQLPSVSFQSFGGPGNNVIYMRGVASGGDGNHSGSLPSVGVYLDEQPVTTIGGNLDVHIYDIARIESLSGPQGTLYGASSEAGTIRIITNKPSTAGFEGRVDGEINTIKNGGVGGTLEGMINAPLSESAALRVVGFYRRDAGYIDNVPGSRAFCGTSTFDGDGVITGCNLDGISVNNTAFVKEDYNYTDTWGARAALKVDLNDTWTATPSVMYQETRGRGTYAFDTSLGDLEVQRFAPETRKDRFIQAALTLEGKLGNWDVTYAGAYLDRTTFSQSDYTDYSESYDALYAAYSSESGFQCSGLAGCFYYQDAAGDTIDPRQRVIGSDHFKKMSHEVRVASPSSDRFRIVAGLFLQRQSNEIYQDYIIDDLGPLVSVNGSPGTLWLTKQDRVDRDYAMFGEMSYDVTDQFTLTAGGRAFIYDNSLIGFFGFGRNPGGDFTDRPFNGAASSRTGVAQCFTTTGDRLRPVAGTPGVTLLPGVVDGTPCTNLGVFKNGTVVPKHARGSGATYRFNATYKPNSDILLYATASRGFRPGGLNRRGDFPDYEADFLKNYELGFKTTLAPGLRLNGAIYRQDWDAFQFSYLGENSFTVITNGPTARINGAELDASYSQGGFSLNLSASYTDAVLKNNLCAGIDPTFACTNTLPSGDPNSIDAPAGTRLPVTPEFKLSGTARYSVPMGSAKAYGQINASYQSEASSDLRTAFAAQYGPLHSYALVNLSAGAQWDRFNIELFVANLFDERGEISKYAQCGSCTRTYIVPTQPRTFGLRVGTEF